MAATTSKDFWLRFFYFACLIYSIWRAVDLLLQVELTGEYEHSPLVTTGDILPRLTSWASHARLRWFGNLRLRPDTPMGVPRPRYSYRLKDSELSGWFTSVEVSEGLRFDAANTESTASFRTVNHDGSPSH